MKYLLTLTFVLFLSSACSSQAVDKEKIKSVLKEDSVLIVDVRTPEEFEAGHAKGSINYPLNSFEDSIRNLDPTRPLIVVCRSGNRSQKATKILSKLGFTHAYDAGKWQNVDEWREE